MAKVKYGFSENDYQSPEVLVNTHSASALRKEYSRLRSIAEKRLKRIGASRFKKSQVYKRYRNKFTASSDIKRTRTIARKLVEVRRFLELREGSVSGIKAVRKERITALRESGYYWINDDNFDAFSDFMDHNRELRKGGEYDSERVLELVRQTDEKGLDPDDVLEEFEFWADNVEALGDIPAPPEKKKKGKASEQIKKQLKDRVIDAVTKGMA